MSQYTDASQLPALPIIVERLRTFLRGQPYVAPSMPIVVSPNDVARVLDLLGHHIVVLTLVARADNTIVAKERQVIFRYCAARAENIGQALSDGEKDALQHY